MKRFCVGDRVVGLGFQSHVDITGMTGTVVSINPFGFDYAVDFDEERVGIVTEYGDVISFHNCGGLAENYHGWYCDGDAIGPLEEVGTWEMAGMSLSGLLV